MVDEVKQLKSKADFDSFIAGDGLSIVHFFAPWAAQCNQLNIVIADLVADLKQSFTATYIDAEEVADVSLAAKIKAAPTVVFYKSGKEVDRLDGFKPAELRTLLIKHTSGGGAAASEGAAKNGGATESLNDRLKRLINQAPLMLFMKGSPDAPRCGFSRTTVGILREHNLAFDTFDILSDEDVRQGLKEYSNWPTYPQLYHKGELLGGLDVLREELKDEEFVASLPKVA